MERWRKKERVGNGKYEVCNKHSHSCECSSAVCVQFKLIVKE